ADSFGIRYDSVGIYINNEINSALMKNLIQLPNAVFACSPVEKYDYLFDIVISSSEDYTSLYTKGKNLKEIVSIRSGFDNRATSIDDVLPIEKIDPHYFLTFDIPPTESKIHDFTITYNIRERG